MSAPDPIADWLRVWLAKVPPGHCPACGKELPEHRGRGRPAYVHPKRMNPECRAEYQRQRAAALTGGTSLREVVARDFSTPGRALIALSCGCVKNIQASAARRIVGRTTCRKHP